MFSTTWNKSQGTQELQHEVQNGRVYKRMKRQTEMRTSVKLNGPVAPRWWNIGTDYFVITRIMQY
jgi:hypothetical protein